MERREDKLMGNIEDIPIWISQMGNWLMREEGEMSCMREKEKSLTMVCDLEGGCKVERWKGWWEGWKVEQVFS